MKEIIATMKFVVKNDSDAEGLKKAIENHPEWLIDFGSWKEIQSYLTVKIEEKDI